MFDFEPLRDNFLMFSEEKKKCTDKKMDDFFCEKMKIFVKKNQNNLRT